MAPRIELVYFTGCPHVHAARLNLREALSASHLVVSWTEWNQSAPDVPARVRPLASPTVLVDGREAGGAVRTGAGATCRAGGAPTVDMILAALERHRSCA
jgi:hypothetical protein